MVDDVKKGVWINAETGEDDLEFDKHQREIKEKEEPEVPDGAELRINPDEERDFLVQALEENEDIKQWTRYNALNKMLKAGKKLTPEQIQFITDINELQRVQAEQQAKEEERQKEDAETKQRLEAEFEKTKQLNPEKIMVAKEERITINGKEGIPQLLKFVIAMKTARKKGGKVVVKVFRERRVVFEWTDKEVTFVEFWSKDEKGVEVREITRFSEYKYNFEGSPIPVLFAIQGYAEGFDFFDSFRKDITSEMVSRIASRSYHSGYLEGINMQDKEKKKGILESLVAWMPLITIIGFIVLGYMLYTMYGEMNTLKEAFNPQAIATAIQNAQIVGQDLNGAMILS